MENKEAIKDFNKAITCLALELPEAIWSDVHLKWLKVHNEIGISASQNEELRKENEELKEDCKYEHDKKIRIFELTKSHRDWMRKELQEKRNLITQLQSTIDENNKEIERLKGLLERYYKSQWHPDMEGYSELKWQQFKTENNL